MQKLLVPTATLFAIASLSACGGGLQHFSPPMQASSQQPSTVQSAMVPSQALTPFALLVMESRRTRVCPTATMPGELACDAIGSDIALAPNADPAATCADVPGCYGPSDLQAAYGIANAAATKGHGMRIGIVDAFGYPRAASDLALYRQKFHLPACGTGNGCLTIVNTSGQRSPLPPANAQWDQEQALDLDMASAICPNCRLVLVETNGSANNGYGLVSGDATALRMSNVVSNSWGGSEWAATYAPFDNHGGKVMTASAGDNGAGNGYGKAGTQEPCAFTGVICVGGTSLYLSGGRRTKEIVWDGLFAPHECSSGPCATGSGCSLRVPKPPWQSTQSTTGCRMRNSTDISADGDPFTGVYIAYGGRLQPGWGGTSASSPMIAAMYALAGNTRTATGATLWNRRGRGLYDVTSGVNERGGFTFVCPASFSYICKARKGYDGPSGWGTPNGLSAL